jgi:hypothetical protein
VTPTLFDLPLRLGDTVALAQILLDVLGAHPKPVDDRMRERVAARAGSIAFQCLRPYVPSIERDPIHPSAYYICVDGVDQQPFLLRVAPSSTPSSGLFPKAILIGRTHLGPREVVINAVPFGRGDRDRIKVFAEQVNKAFLPKPGTKPLTYTTGDASTSFETFRKTLNSTGQNQAAFALAEGQNKEEFYFTVVWSAIRAGWREGYVISTL